jgi:excinuclease ABC subunit C
MKQSQPNRHEENLESRCLALPNKPGVYLFKNSASQVLYVGKAKDLKKRVLSYFKPSGGLSQKTSLMMRKADDLEYILTATEKEAFILERNLIKKFMPRYNIILRDDKQYPCLRLDINSPYPRLSIVRKMKKDGAVYFGPFSSANSVRSTLKLIDRIFRLRKCKRGKLQRRTRPCLNYQLGRCLGLCTHEVPEATYKEIVDQVRLFLEGRNRELITQLKKDMASASSRLNFEEAARIRDQIRAVENTIERQHVVSPKMEDQDIIGHAQKNGDFQLVILFVRRGHLMGNRSYFFRDKGGSVSEVMEAFLKQYYPKERFIPKHILISEPVEDLISIKDWISDLAGKRISIHHPRRGEKLRLVRMAVENAENLLAKRTELQREDLNEMLRDVLQLKKIPRFIEGFDISTLHGDMAVGTVVSFVDGLPHKEGYRNYKIRGVEGIDDYGMMSELVSRRLAKKDLPDLFVVDGGKGHLLAVKKVMDHFPGIDAPDLVAIAKSDERGGGIPDKIYIPGRKNHLSLKRDHPALLLLMRIRDEAHRRAVTYHRKLRGKVLKESDLDHIPGIGLQRKRLLLRQFGDVNAVSRAKREQLLSIPGISRSLAENIENYFENREHQK